MTADGAVWYVETGEDTKNVLVRFNPVTKKVLTWPIPGGGGQGGWETHQIHPTSPTYPT